MTRASFCQETPRRGCKCLHSFPPWEVPKKRKPRGVKKGRDCYEFYDPTEGSLFSSRVGKVTTQNRYSPLVGLSVDVDFDFDEEGPLQEFGPTQNSRIPRRGLYRDQKDFFKSARDDLACSICFKDDVNTYVYENKINFSSGYFPEYILYPCVDIDDVNPDCITDKIDLNLDY